MKPFSVREKDIKEESSSSEKQLWRLPLLWRSTISCCIIAPTFLIRVDPRSPPYEKNKTINYSE
jgi:hypothetical protein